MLVPLVEPSLFQNSDPFIPSVALKYNVSSMFFKADCGIEPVAPILMSFTNTCELQFNDIAIILTTKKNFMNKKIIIV